ncbi:hypothetical protein METBIDRAFT_11620 [Metschnikowia bicuspidata var. bicuspidata NRRL YB-4993]|uniref:C2H2-type domain-containing protein n=1 Tax=Metschnikowia bicuspidata var. bicuspidata NRRL YB-4993 TaxID=869754 RepID=A0A1A0HAX1_9ASCO|nr:hypothetical protein METBIDRAFT_11620 [Metschnikowia bicuspidata var. bicuspidata NRRL YB-4993]OBA21033.1 hypothetical protein METBIDRAFT_11620 [Metschnikowia bicuspidata var. bicuspidata NRRL YB-4993]
MTQMIPSSLAQGDIMRELEGFGPSELRKKLELEVSAIKSASETDPLHDPIMTELMKIQGRSLPIIPGGSPPETPDFLIEQLSLRLRELLELVLDPAIPDDARMLHEQALKELISKEPTIEKGEKSYPNDYLSRILIDNYSLFLKISTQYFNLSLASLVTRYLVSLVYSLECWEIYHLLHVVPNLEYILKLLEFDISCTSFGHIVRPPENFLNFNLRQGLQYPFPFPFYNFSYHSIDPKASTKKMDRITIKPYIDLRLDKLELKAPSKTKARKLSATPAKPTEAELAYLSDSDSSANSEDFRKWKILYLFVEMTPEKIQHDFDLCFVTPTQRAYEEEDYDSDRAKLIEAKEQETIDASMPELPVTPSVFQKAFTKAHDTGLVKHTFLHQCKLMDPESHKTCLKVFYGKNELHRHQEFVHATKKRMYRCAYCPKEDADEKNKVYPRYDSLARHIRRKHGIVGSENKLAVLLARRVAESEDIFGKLPALPYEYAETVPELVPGPLASITDTTGILIKENRFKSEGNIVDSHPKEYREMLAKSELHKKARTALASNEPQKRTRKSVGGGSLEHQEVPYNEFKCPTLLSSVNAAGPLNARGPADASDLVSAAAHQSAASERPAPGRPALGSPAVDRPDLRHPAPVRTALGGPEAERPAAERPAAERPAAERPAAERPREKLAAERLAPLERKTVDPAPGMQQASAPWLRDSASVFEYRGPQKQRAGLEISPSTRVPDVAQYPQQLHSYGAYASNFTQPMYTAPDGNLVYGHGPGVRLPSQTTAAQYPYMHQMYAAQYAGEYQAAALAQQAPNEGSRNPAASPQESMQSMHQGAAQQYAKKEDPRHDNLR